LFAYFGSIIPRQQTDLWTVLAEVKPLFAKSVPETQFSEKRQNAVSFEDLPQWSCGLTARILMPLIKLTIWHF
jgi:hypothetical protein